MAMNWLKLNNDKTEFIVLGTPGNLAKVATEAIHVGDHDIEKCPHVRNIGAMFDSTMKMDVQVNKVSQTAWFHLHSISKIRLSDDRTNKSSHRCLRNFPTRSEQ
jgi:hypothetical protein